MNMKNNYVGELQEFEIAMGRSAPTYVKCQVPVNGPDGKGVQLKFIATVQLSGGIEHSSSKAYVKYSHAKNDAAYVALCAERAVSRKDATTPSALPSSSEVIRSVRVAVSVPEDRTIHATPDVPLHGWVARVLSLETTPASKARIIWHDADFDTLCRFSTVLRTMNIYHAHRCTKTGDCFDIFC